MNVAVIVWLCILGVGLVVLLVLVLISLSSIEFGEVGLDYSSITKTIDKVTYTSGIHFLGVGHSFVRYPTLLQTMEFSKLPNATGPLIASRTKDGLEVTLEISLQYKILLVNSSIYDLYMKFDTNYQLAYKVFAIDILTDVATSFTAYQFFYDRQGIGDAMKNHLSDGFKDFAFASVEFFQLRQVDLPDPFETAIQESEVMKQDIEKAKAEKVQMEVQLETRIKQAEYQKEVNVNIAKGNAEALLKQNEVDVESFNYTQMSRANAYASLKSTLGMNDKQLLKFMKTKIIKEFQQPENMVISIQQIGEV